MQIGALLLAVKVAAAPKHTVFEVAATVGVAFTVTLNVLVLEQPVDVPVTV